MNIENEPTIALCYDFDKTLSPRDMQEYGFIEQFHMSPDEFWGKKEVLGAKYNAESILSYLFYMMKMCKDNNIKLTRKSLVEWGKKVELYSGLETWFKRINEFGKSVGVNIEHYVISSGIKPMIEGTSIAKEFKRIFACDFMYDELDEPFWPAHAINYTTKTQFLFRINKGVLDGEDNAVNAHMDKDLRPVPFSNIVYIGDSATDIPCMRLTVKSGGHSIGVYNPKNKISDYLLNLVKDDRINFYATADYTAGSELEQIVEEIILKIKHSTNLYVHTLAQKKE